MEMETTIDFNAAINSESITPEMVAGGEVRINDPFDPAPLLGLFEKFGAKIDEMALEANGHDVVDDESASKSAEMAAQARKIASTISKKQKEVTAPYHDVKATVDRECKRLKDRLTCIQRTLEGKNRPYLMKKERERREAEQKAREEAAREQRELEAAARAKQQQLNEEAAKEGKTAPVVETPPVVVAPTQKPVVAATETGKQQLKTEWTWELLDLGKIPEECLKARMEHIKKAIAPWINAQIKAGVRSVQGFNIFEKTEVKTTVRR